MKSILLEIGIGLFRYLLICLSTWLIAKGALSEEHAAALLNHPHLPTILGGAVLGIGTIIWMVFNKLKTRLTIETALQMPQGSSPRDLQAIVEAKSKGELSDNVMPLLLLLPLLSACAPLSPATQAKWGATGSFLVEKISKIAWQTVITAAVSQTDRENKANLIDALATAFYSQPVASAEDVASLVQIWTPQKTHWDALAEQLSTQYAEGITVGQIAQGLNASAAHARTTD